MALYNKWLKLLIVAILIEVGTFLLISKFISSHVMFIKFPLCIVLIATMILLAKLISDSFAIKEETNNFEGISSSIKKLRWISILFSIVGSVLLVYLQYISVTTNFLWGVYVQITIFFFIMERKHYLEVHNVPLVFKNGKKSGTFSPSKFIASFYQMKFYGLAIWFLIGNIFLGVAVHIGKKFDVQWEWYDLPSLYIFFVMIGILYWGLLASSGYFLSKKQKKASEKGAGYEL